MTLLLIALAATMLAGVCRLSLEKSVRSAREAEQLQRHWGEVSCRSTFLPRAERVLLDAGGAGRDGRKDGDGARTAAAELWLGGQQIRLQFADEQAKLDVAALYARHGRVAAERAARAAARAGERQGGGRLELRLRPVARPVPSPAGQAARAAAFDSFGQVFDESKTAGAAPGDVAGQAILAASGDLTCWGGRLNWRRAEPADLQSWCEPVLNQTQVGQLLRIRQGLAAGPVGAPPAPRAPGAAPSAPAPASLSAALSALQLPEEKQRAVGALLTDESHCHSLWIVTRWGGGGACSLAVLEERPGEPAEMHTFSW